MIDLKNLHRAIQQIGEEKGIEAEKIMEVIESSIAAAYKKEYEKKSEIIKAKFDQKTGSLNFWQIKTVVTEDMVRMVNEDEEGFPTPTSDIGENEEEKLPRYNPDRHILLEEAKKIKPDAVPEEEMLFPLETREDFGRIAAQTAKQVILQKLREAERDSVLKEFQNREGEIVSGVVQRFDQGNVFIDLGRASGIMFYNETIPGEHYRPSERLRFLIVSIQNETRIPGIILSRSHPRFIEKLFALEVPEVADGLIEVKAIAREPGSRTKISVSSNNNMVDPVGSCVGPRGTRVMAVSNEIGQEKIDIIPWSEEPTEFISNALSPAKVKEVKILPRREAQVFVPEDQLSLAIGRGGQNVRLAAKLTGWKIDVRSESRPNEINAEGVAQVERKAESVKEKVATEDNQA